MYSQKPKLHQNQKKNKPGALRSILIDVTAKCNMKCSHCYADTFSNKEPVELPILKQAMDELYELEVYHYILMGGEPMADCERLEAIIGMIRADECYINVVSNGWGMTLEKIRWLKDLQVDKIAFSLDSGIESEHDQNRKPGSFQRVLEAVDNVLSEGLLSEVSTVVTHQSLYSEGFKKALEYTQSKKVRLGVQIAEPVGKWDGKTEILITPEDARYIKQLQIDAAVLPNGQKAIFRDLYTGEKDHCIAGGEFLALTTDGNLLPCNFLQFSLGNIKDKTIKEMRESIIKSPWFDGRHPMCLCGENAEFISQYIVPYVNEPKPLDAHKIFNL